MGAILPRRVLAVVGLVRRVGPKPVYQGAHAPWGCLLDGRRLELDFFAQAHPVFLSAAAMPAMERSSG